MKKIIILMALMIFLAGNVLAENTLCCEKNIDKVWCQDVPYEQCDTNFRTDQSTSCGLTNYCQLGTCYNGNDGTCSDRVPKVVCDEENGVFSQLPIDQVPACKLGCCANLGSLLTEIACNYLSSEYGVEIDFRGGIQDSALCESFLTSGKKGACVLETETRRTCKIFSQQDCLLNPYSTGEFYEDYLCSDKTLVKADCYSSKNTICGEEDKVYFIDTCDNIANIYDSEKQTDQNYWSKKIQLDDEDLCSMGDNNENSNSCGNCNYLPNTGELGSVCGTATNNNPLEMGEYICEDLGCEYDTNDDGIISSEEKFANGEAWCSKVSGGQMLFKELDGTVSLIDALGDLFPLIVRVEESISFGLFGGDTFTYSKITQDTRFSNLPGTRYIRLTCRDGKVDEDPCEDQREEICIDQKDSNNFNQAVCQDNLWEDCYEQTSSDNCENKNERDCYWVKNTFSEKLGGTYTSGNQNGYCVPLFAPGFQSYKPDSKVNEQLNVEQYCALASIKCKYEIDADIWPFNGGIDDGEECINEDQSVKSKWLDEMEKRCMRLGDCGLKQNYLEEDGEKERNDFWDSPGHDYENNFLGLLGSYKGVVSYSCDPWLSPKSGEGCEECNLQVGGCTEYQCKSSGKYCSYTLDEDPEERICYFDNIRDTTSPTIHQDESVFSSGYKYSDLGLPDPDKKIKISPNEEECISPHEFLTFGVYTLNQNDEPEQTQCKWALERYNPTQDNFGDWGTFFDYSGSYKYNHLHQIKIPEIIEGGEDEVSIYVKCQDHQENINPNTFAFNFCLKEGPDTNPPTIIETNPLNGAAISVDQSETDLMIYIDKSAECKWTAIPNRRYSDMENNFTCIQEEDAIGLYPCNTTLTGLRNGEENKFYFSCKSYPELEEVKRFTMATYEYILQGTRPLSILNAEPNATVIEDSVSPTTITLRAETFGGNQEGYAICSYSELEEGPYLQFANTIYDSIHSTQLSLEKGNYNYFIRCIDFAGNSNTVKINFSVDVDIDIPIIVRAYYEEGNMKIITNEIAECRYSPENCLYDFESGTRMTTFDDLKHYFEWDTESDLYVKCQDAGREHPKIPEDCAMILRAHDSL